MRSRTQRWFPTVPIDDPIDRHLAAIIQMMLGGLSIAVVVGSLLYALYEQSLIEAARPIKIGVLILIFVGLGLLMLRRGQLAAAGLVTTTGLLFALAINFNGLGFHTGAGLAITFILPIALAGFLAGRRGLMVTMALSLMLMTGTAWAEQHAPSLAGFVSSEELPASVIILGFALVAGVIGLFIDLFGRALRQALAASIARERELEMRTAELSKAKRQLEAELAVRKSAEAALAN
jgi:hypothetical protein